MKRIFTIAAVVAAASVSAQTVDTVSTTTSYANDVFYSLADGIVSSVPKDNWDIAFSTGGRNSTVLANTQGNGRVYLSPFHRDDFATVDTTGMTWNRQDDDPTTWNIGAYDRNSLGGFDYGWGVYYQAGNPYGYPDHTVSGDSVFIVKTSGGTFKKLYIDAKTPTMWIFTFANLDGTDEVKDTILPTNYSNKNFAYYSLDSARALDREPATSDWNMLFTKYITYDYGSSPGTPQAVTGVLLNKRTESVKAYPVDVETVSYEDFTFSSAKNTIGHDWKHVDYSAPPYPWLVADSTVYFLTDTVSTDTVNIYKIVFTGFGGTADGNYIFTKEVVASIITTPVDTTTPTGINEIADNFTVLQLYPNPTHNFVTLVYNYSNHQPFNTAVNIFDMTGRMVLTQSITLEKGLNKEVLNIASLESGVYTVAYPELSNKTQKLIVR